MKRLDRLILSEIIGPYLFSVLLFTSLFMGADNLLKILEFAGKGVPTWILIQFFLMSLPTVLALTSPMAMLLATLYGFGRLSGDSELTALSAAGVPLERIMAPVAVFAFAVSCVGMYINDTVVPLSEHGRQTVINEQKQKAGQAFGGSSFTYRKTDDNNRLTLLVHAESPLTTIGAGRIRLNDVTINRFEEGKPTETIFCSSAEGSDDSANWVLSGARAFGVRPNGNSYRIGIDGFTGKQTTLATPGELLTASRPNEELTNAQLQEKVRALSVNGSNNDSRAVEVEMMKRFMVPLGTFIFALVGAPLGITPSRASKGVGFGYSVLISFVYWIALQIVSVLGRSGTLPPILAVALPNLAGIALGVYLIWRIRR